MKFMGLLAVSLATASARSDVGKLIFQGAADAVKLFEPIPEGGKSAILTCAAELLKKHVTFRPDGTASAVCSAHGRPENRWRAFKRQGRRYAEDPFYGGSNPLHLDLFACGGSDPPEGSAQLIVHPVHPRRATLIVEDFSSWCAALERFGNSLPEDPHHSWHVDVFHKPGGYLGLFRRSRATGRWFQGKHHIHLAGNPQDR